MKSLISKIRKRVFKYILILLRHFAARKHYKLAGLITILCIKKIKTGKPELTTSKKYKILCLSKAVFTEDVISSLGTSPEFILYSVPRKVIKAIAAAYLSPLISDNNYVANDPEMEKQKQLYRNFLIQMWRYIDRYRHFDSILSGNFGYYAERELAAALNILEIPFIALHKESLKSPVMFDFWEQLYREQRGVFSGRKVLVYNEIERQIQISSGVSSREQIVVTGMPRLDRIHSWRMNTQHLTKKVKTPQVLFFAFSPNTGLPSIYNDSKNKRMENLQWTNLYKNCLTCLIALARNKPDIHVIIKMKNTDQAEKDQALLSRLLREDRLPNVELVFGGDPLNLIYESDVICGFNSTALLEAIAADKPVIVPYFDEAQNEEMSPYVVDLEGAVEYALSPEDLELRLYALAYEQKDLRKNLPENMLKVLDRWTGNRDGQSGNRVRDNILAEIEKSRSSSM